MVEVDTQHKPGTLILEVRGWDKLWSLTSRLELPLEHVRAVYADSAPASGWFDSIKVAGASIPHILRAGTFYQQGDLVFWDVHHPEKTLVLELADERFAKLIVEVEDPDTAIAQIRQALAAAREHRAHAIAELDQYLTTPAPPGTSITTSTLPTEPPVQQQNNGRV